MASVIRVSGIQRYSSKTTVLKLNTKIENTDILYVYMSEMKKYAAEKNRHKTGSDY
jgi:hypothetical protein